MFMSNTLDVHSGILRPGLFLFLNLITIFTNTNHRNMLAIDEVIKDVPHPPPSMQLSAKIELKAIKLA